MGRTAARAGDGKHRGYGGKRLSGDLGRMGANSEAGDGKHRGYGGKGLAVSRVGSQNLFLVEKNFSTCYHKYMKIRMRYFASLREVVGLNEEILDLREGGSVADVRALLLSRYPRLQTIMERSVCAVNHAYVTAETVLHEGDEVVWIPPVGGGCSV